MPYKDSAARRKFHREYMAVYRNRPGQKTYTRKKQKEYKARNRSFVARIKRRFGCRCCGLKNPVCLDFHHLKDKKINIGEMIGMTHSIETIKAEMRKCIILCANCHRVEEAKKKELR